MCAVMKKIVLLDPKILKIITPRTYIVKVYGTSVRCLHFEIFGPPKTSIVVS